MVKVVSVSSLDKGYKINSILDGDKKTQWRSKSSKNEWVIFDFEKCAHIDYFELYVSEGKRIKSGKIQFADKNDSDWHTVTEFLNENKNGAFKIKLGEDYVPGRYCKLLIESSHSGWISINDIHFEFSDIPVIVEPLEKVNIVLASSCDKGYNILHTIDGVEKTQWRAKSAKNEWVVFDFGNALSLDKIEMYVKEGKRIKNGNIQVTNVVDEATGDADWVTICNFEKKKEPLNVTIDISQNSLSYRYCKIHISSTHGGWISINTVTFFPTFPQHSPPITPAVTDVDGDGDSIGSNENAVNEVEEFFKLININALDDTCRNFIAESDYDNALIAWRDFTVNRLRHSHFLPLDRHMNIRTQHKETADMLVGKLNNTTYEKNKTKYYFKDIYNCRKESGNGTIKWLVKQSVDAPYKYESVYATAYCFTTMVARYWNLGNVRYIKKWFYIVGDFCRRHKNLVKDFTKKQFESYGSSGVGSCRWEPTASSSLAQGHRTEHFVKSLAIISKHEPLNDDNWSEQKRSKDDWYNCLNAVDTPASQELLDMVDPVLLMYIVKSLVMDHPDALLKRYSTPNAAPNQRMTGLRALCLITLYFPEFKRCNEELYPLMDNVLSNFIHESFYPDGGMFEASFNYNNGDAEKIKNLVYLFKKNNHQDYNFVKLAEKFISKWEHLTSSLITPLGGHPQIGNNSIVSPPAVWENKNIANDWLQNTKISFGENRESKAFVYSGYYSMRKIVDKECSLNDIYMFFMANRHGRGHKNHDHNSIQLSAFGRQMLVHGGPPTYSQYKNYGKIARDYLVAESTQKTNTVLVDEKSQTYVGSAAPVAYTGAIECKWYTSDKFDLVEGVYDEGYGEEWVNGKRTSVDMSVCHNRKLIFVKEKNVWIVVDNFINKDETLHTYTNVWKVPPFYKKDNDFKKHVCGFKRENVNVSIFKEHHVIYTNELMAPNLYIHHYNNSKHGRIKYTMFYGDEDKKLGWFARHIGDAIPSVDIQCEWSSKGTCSYVSIIEPTDKGKTSNIREITKDTVVFKDGDSLCYCHYLNGGNDVKIGNKTVKVKDFVMMNNKNGIYIDNNDNGVEFQLNKLGNMSIMDKF